MLKRKYYTSQLVEEADREAVELRPSRPPSRFRNFQFVFRLLRLLFHIFWGSILRKLDGRQKARMTRKMLEDFGGLWIKIGQLFSMRTDLFSMGFCEEMAKLQDRVQGFSESEAIAIVERELCASIGQVFSIFSSQPIAAASVAQVHKAKVRKEQKWVAVKIQRPHSDQLLKQDMMLFKRLAGLLHLLGMGKKLVLDEIIWELNQLMAEELDFRYEIANMKRMRKMLKPQSIYVPKCFDCYSGRKIIVMEWLQGVTISEYIKVVRTEPDKARDWAIENKIDPRKVGNKLILSHLRQIFEENLYHGDLHPGNIMLLARNKVALIDFGNVGSSDVEFLELYKQYLFATYTKQFAKAADILFLMMPSVPPIDLTYLKGKVMQHLKVNDIKSFVKGLPFREKTITGSAEGIDQFFLEAGFEADWSRLKIGRAIGTLDLTLPFLDPELSYYKTFDKYGRQYQKRNRVKLLRKLARLPELMEEHAAYVLPNIRRDAIGVKGTLSKAQAFLAWLLRGFSLSLWLVFLFLLWTYLSQHHGHWLGEEETTRDWLGQLVDAFPQQHFTSWVLIIGIVLFVQLSLHKFLKQYKTAEAIYLRK